MHSKEQVEEEERIMGGKGGGAGVGARQGLCTWPSPPPKQGACLSLPGLGVYPGLARAPTCITTHHNEPPTCPGNLLSAADPADAKTESLGANRDSMYKP